LLHYGPGVDSASNIYEYQKYFLGDKGGRCEGLTTLPPSCADCLEIREPQLIEPSVLVQACNGIALLLRFNFKHRIRQVLTAVSIKFTVFWSFTP